MFWNSFSFRGPCCVGEVNRSWPLCGSTIWRKGGPCLSHISGWMSLRYRMASGFWLAAVWWTLMPFLAAWHSQSKSVSPPGNIGYCIQTWRPRCCSLKFSHRLHVLLTGICQRRWWIKSSSFIRKKNNLERQVCWLIEAFSSYVYSPRAICLKESLGAFMIWTGHKITD